MTDVTITERATGADMWAIVAEAHIVLSTEAPATTGVLVALAQLERLLPPSGTPEYREAFRTAHIRRGDANSPRYDNGADSYAGSVGQQ